MNFPRRAKHVFLGSMLALIMFVITASVTNAQYPPPVGSASLSASTPVVGLGGTTTLSTQILDQFGAPLVGVEVVFTIASEPGTDAALGSKTVTKVTDSQGYAFADLMVGSTPGVIVVTATAGVFSTSTLVQVAPAGGGVSAPAPGAPAQPFPTAGSIILPPSTGDAGFVEASTSQDGAFPMALTATVLVLLALVVRRCASQL